MELVELLRVRASLMWHVGILLLIGLSSALIGNHAEVQLIGPGETTNLQRGMTVPFEVIAPLAMLFAAIFASSAGTSLNRENATRELSWTKPISRTILALRYIAIDVAAVMLMFALTVAVTLVVLAFLHVTLLTDAQVGADFVLALGASVMWYALVQVLTFWLGSGGRSVGGILWPVSFVLTGLAHLSGPAGTIARTIDLVNPLAYISGVTYSSDGSRVNSAFGGPVELKIAAVWLFAAAFCAIAIAVWPRKEV
jgi:hypothetical protein